MKISCVMTKIINPISTYIDISKNIADAAKLMAEANTDTLLIKENDILVGTISAKDINLKVLMLSQNPSTINLKHIMSPVLLYCYESDDSKLLIEKINKLQTLDSTCKIQVLDAHKRLVGNIPIEINKKTKEIVLGHIDIFSTGSSSKQIFVRTDTNKLVELNSIDALKKAGKEVEQITYDALHTRKQTLVIQGTIMLVDPDDIDKLQKENKKIEIISYGELQRRQPVFVLDATTIEVKPEDILELERSGQKIEQIHSHALSSRRRKSQNSQNLLLPSNITEEEIIKTQTIINGPIHYLYNKTRKMNDKNNIIDGSISADRILNPNNSIAFLKFDNSHQKVNADQKVAEIAKSNTVPPLTYVFHQAVINVKQKDTLELKNSVQQRKKENKKLSTPTGINEEALIERQIIPNGQEHYLYSKKRKINGENNIEENNIIDDYKYNHNNLASQNTPLVNNPIFQSGPGHAFKPWKKPTI